MTFGTPHPGPQVCLKSVLKWKKVLFLHLNTFLLSRHIFVNLITNCKTAMITLCLVFSFPTNSSNLMQLLVSFIQPLSKKENYLSTVSCGPWAKKWINLRPTQKSDELPKAWWEINVMVCFCVIHLTFDGTTISDRFKVFHLRIHYLYDFWTSAAVISCWYNHVNLPEKKTERNFGG